MAPVGSLIGMNLHLHREGSEVHPLAIYLNEIIPKNTSACVLSDSSSAVCLA